MRLIRLFLLVFAFCVKAGSLSAQGRGFVEINGGGYVTSVLSCPVEKDLFYAKTDVGGVFRWQAASNTWKPLFGWVANDQTSYLGVEALAIDPQAPNKLYALVGTSYWNGGKSAILRSQDYGETYSITEVTSLFKANGNGSDRQKGESLAVDPNDGRILYCGSRYSNGLFKSTDSGVTWSAVSSFGAVANIDASISFVAFDPNSGEPGKASQTIYVGVFRTGNNLYVSHDGGTTWEVMAGSYSGGKPNRCWVYSDIFQTNLYITYGWVEGGDGAVMRYNTLYNQWYNITPSVGKTYSGICVDRDDPSKIVVSTYNQWNNRQEWGWADFIYYSEDGGATWKERASQSVATMDNNGVPWLRAAIHWIGCVTFDPYNPARVFAVSGNGIFHTDNIASTSGVKWKFMAEGLEEIVMLDGVSILGGPLITSVGDQGGFVHTNVDEAPSLKISQSTGFGYSTLVSGRIVRADDAGLLLSLDNGLTWTRLGANPKGLFKGTVGMSADGNVILWRVSEEGSHYCYRTTDFGKTWTEVPSGARDFIPMADPVNKDKFYSYDTSNGFMYVSEDGGATFRRKGAAGAGGNRRIAVAPGLEGHIWIGKGNNGITYTTDSGVTFKAIPVANCSAISIGKAYPGASYPTIFIYGKPSGSDVIGIYRSMDMGATWKRVDNDQRQYGHLANAGMIVADQNVPGRVYRSTAGIGIPYFDAEGLSSGIGSELSGSNTPICYPNPFSSSFTLELAGDVEVVEIYSITGSKVFEKQVGNIGLESLQLGQDLAPGVYLLRLRGKSASKVIKIRKLV